MSIFINYPPLLEGRGGILFYLCPSVRPSVHPRYFSAHFSLTIDDRNLIYGHKHHIGIPYCGKRLDPSDSYFLFADLVRFYTHWTYMHIFCHIFLNNYWWQRSDIWSQASYRYPISWEAFFGLIRFLLPLCRLCWFLYTLNIHFVYAHF